MSNSSSHSRQLDDAAEIHHRDALAEMPHDRQIVRDEQVGQAEALAQILEQIDDLRLDRDVERRDRLVADDEFRLERQSARDPDALALAARHFVRVAIGEIRTEPQIAATRAPAPRGAPDRARCRAPSSARR